MRRFLISRETLSVRMLDASQDPTPLLKEIRDDKVATIIIDANASTSYHILSKVLLLLLLLLLLPHPQQGTTPPPPPPPPTTS